jgi:subtilisin family serine protease
MAVVVAMASFGSPVRAASLSPGAEATYVVMLRDPIMSAARVQATADGMAARHGGRIRHVYTAALRGFSMVMKANQARSLAADPRVSYVEPSRTVVLADRQADPPNWGLDRIDQANNLQIHDEAFRWHPGTSGAGVTVYVIDTGVRITHQEFGGRASHAWDVLGNDGTADDSCGHGTHVAALIAGATYGVAKNASIKSIRAFNCLGGASEDALVEAMDYVLLHATPPAVVNISAGVGFPSRPVNGAALSLTQNGFDVVTAAGNGNGDACIRTSSAVRAPAMLPEAITVGSSLENDSRASTSNYGGCVDVYAPGDSIRSADACALYVAPVFCLGSDTATSVRSGTSMAAAFVSGVVAQYRQAAPTWTPAQMQTWLVDQATDGKLANIPSGSQNQLLHSAWWGPIVVLRCTGWFDIVCRAVQEGSPVTTIRWRLSYGGAPSVPVPLWDGQTEAIWTCDGNGAATSSRITVQVSNVHNHADSRSETFFCL